MSDPISRSIIVKGNVSDVYSLWANFENFPIFMKHIKSVTKTGERESHWVMQGPLGATIEWDAETTRLDENQRIAWSSTDGDIKTSGQVTFAELTQGETEITVTLHYVPPAGTAGELAAELFGNPEGMLIEDLRRFKEHVEGTQQRIHGENPPSQES